MVVRHWRIDGGGGVGVIGKVREKRRTPLHTRRDNQGHRASHLATRARRRHRPLPIKSGELCAVRTNGFHVSALGAIMKSAFEQNFNRDDICNSFVEHVMMQCSLKSTLDSPPPPPVRFHAPFLRTRETVVIQMIINGACVMIHDMTILLSFNYYVTAAAVMVALCRTEEHLIMH